MANIPKVLRCAIYTRKSSEEGLEQEFNSLDAQRKPARPISRARSTKAGKRHCTDMTMAVIPVERCNALPLMTCSLISNKKTLMLS